MHNVGANPRSCGGPAGIENGGFYNTIRRNEVYQVQPNFASYDGSGCDWDGFDCDDVGGNLSQCFQNYAHNDWGPGYLLFVSDHHPWADDSMSYNISENDNAHTNDRTLGAMNISGACATLGPTLVANNTVYQDATAMGVNTAGGSVSCPQNGLWVNNIIAVTAGPLGQATLFTTNNKAPLINFIGNAWFAITGTPSWYQVPGGTVNTLAAWQAVINGGDVGATTGTNPGFSGTLPVGTCTWTVSSTGHGPQPCPAAYVINNGSQEQGAGAALNYSPFTFFTTFGVNVADYYGNTIPMVSPNLHNMGAYDTGGGTESNSPIVSLISPAAGAASGTLTLTASASETSGSIQGVQFVLDGVPMNTPLSFNIPNVCSIPATIGVPYSTEWSTLCTTDGVHTLSAIAYDFSGKSTTSAAVSITVNNSVPSCSQATAFLARAPNQFLMTTLFENNYKILICGGVSDGWWAKLDVLQVYATYFSSAALTNLISTSFNASEVGAPVFTTGGGFNANAPTEHTALGFIDTGYAPATAGGLFTLNSSSAAVCTFESTTIDTTSFYTGTAIQTSDYGDFIIPKFGDGNTYGRINDAGGTGIVNAGTTSAFTGVNRSGVSASQIYRNGSLVFSPNATSTSIGAGDIFAGGDGTAAQYNGLLMEFAAGQSLTGTDWSNLYNRLRAWNINTIGGSC